jgi:hypothetical protein
VQVGVTPGGGRPSALWTKIAEQPDDSASATASAPEGDLTRGGGDGA